MKPPQKWYIIDLLSHLFASIIETLRGPSTISEIPAAINDIECLMGYSLMGYSLRIHCLEKRYILNYKYWFMASREHAIYHVYAVVSQDAPEKLKMFCSEDRQFPKILNRWMPSASQKEAAIMAYLDLIIENFKK